MSQKPPEVDKEFGYGAYSYDEIDNMTILKLMIVQQILETQKKTVYKS